MSQANQGLLYRVRRAARQIGDQHSQLDALLVELTGAIECGRAQDARELLARYRSAIDAHFALEEGVFFPALHGLHPGHGRDLELLGAEHDGFLHQIDRLVGLLPRELEAFARGLRSLASELSVHESREERLVRTLAADAQRRD